MKKALAIAALTAISAAAQASTIFSDDFEANTAASNATPSGWSVSGGTVDTVGPGYFSNLCVAGHGTCIDLDGSTGVAGVLSKSFNFTAGVQYTASFELAGSQRGSTETGIVSFGNQSLNFSLASGAGFSAYQLVFTPGSTGAYTLSFANNSRDNVGALLDNVSITAVPEPETYAMFAGRFVHDRYGKTQSQSNLSVSRIGKKGALELLFCYVFNSCLRKSPVRKRLV